MRVRAATIIPCFLTCVRVAITPLLLLFIMQGAYPGAFAVFIAICLTDIFDGIAARALGTCTRLGAYMDVFADVLYILSSLLVLNATGHAPLWFTMAAALKFTEFAVTSAILKRGGGKESTWVFDAPGRCSAVLIFLSPGVFCLSALQPGSMEYVVYFLLIPACALAAVSSARRITRCIRCMNIHRDQRMQEVKNDQTVESRPRII